MGIKYKQKCYNCDNYFPITRKRKYAKCYDCQKKYMQGAIEDPEMKELLDIPNQYYKLNGFLRNIKISYLRNKSLSEPQIRAFKKTVKRMEKVVAEY